MDATRATNAKASTNTTTKAKTTKRGKLCKCLNITEVRAISKAISKPCQDSVSTIWNSIKTSQHLAIFPQRKRFCELLDSELHDQLKQFVEGLIADYADSTRQGRTVPYSFKLCSVFVVHVYVQSLFLVVYSGSFK